MTRILPFQFICIHFIVFVVVETTSFVPSTLASTQLSSQLEAIGLDRRSWLATVATILPTAALASDSDIRWITGKEPVVPGKKPRDKSDVSGTRKDPNFLRSLADCKNQCENSAGPDGFAKAKEDCLSECQDICCRTYSQCTFAIVPRI